ncbi:CHAT domain-containing tetratricopeptide repeat protein [Streptomyces abyssomicinicus]|uniref:CHAT domain-containing tetratricopeptide repeat protein n=1 Tax=Streptomyces abyssomicinicus TaxID=574929 RepID=UPI00125092E7|nr:CHAT domain-containing protein [Streptomyces abyssomicinicus]
MNHGRGLSTFERITGILTRVPKGSLDGTDLGRRAYAAWQKWLADTSDKSSLEKATSLYEEALQGISELHAQYRDLVDQVAGCHRNLWLIGGDPHHLRVALDLWNKNVVSTPAHEVHRWAEICLAIMQVHVLRFGATSDMTDARLAEECHRSLSAVLGHQPWAPGLRASAFLTAAQLAAVQGDRNRCDQLLKQARQAFGGPLVPASEPELETWFRCLDLRSRFLRKLYQSTYDDVRCQEALALISCGISAFGEQPGDSQALIMRRGDVRLTRYRLLGQEKDAAGARQDLETALHLCPTEQVKQRSDLKRALTVLSVLMSRDTQLAVADQEAALRLAEESLASTQAEAGSVDHALHVLVLAEARQQFARHPGIASLRETADLYEQALSALHGTEHAWEAHSGVCSLRKALYEAEGHFEHLTAAISHAEQALALCPARDVQREGPVLRSELGHLLLLRYERDDCREDYELALQRTREGVERVELARYPGAAPLWANRVSNHAVALAAPGPHRDVAAAERLLRDALDSESLPLYDQATLHHNLGTVQREAGEARQDGSQLRSAIAQLRMAVALAQTDSRIRRLAQRNLALAQYACWRLEGHSELLDQAVETVDAALEEASETGETYVRTPQYPLLLADLGAFLVARGEHHAEMEEGAARGLASRDLERAVVVLETALRFLPSSHRLWATARAQYGQALKSLGLLAGDRNRERELTVQRQAMDALHEDDPVWADHALLLARDLADTEHPTPEEADEAWDLLLRAARHTLSPPLSRWHAALSAASLRGGQGDWSAALDACVEAIAVLPQLAWGGLAFDDKLRVLGNTSQSVSDLAAIALNAGAPEQALEFLEHGRGQLLSQALDLRSDLQAVDVQDPALAARLALIRDDHDPRAGDGDGAGMFRRRRQHDWDDLVQQVRRLPGLDGFLKPMPCHDLVATAEHGPVVVLNSSELRSDALVLRDGSLTVVPLRLFQHDKAVLRTRKLLQMLHPAEDETGELHELREYLTDLIDWLWVTVAEPVLSALDPVGEAGGVAHPLPRIWWCPTGVFNHLPVHAATQGPDVRDPDGPARDSLANRFVSSHTPTLRALKAAREAEKHRVSATTSPVLLVGVSRVPSDPGLEPLTNVTKEIDAVSQLFPRALPPLCDEEATRDAVIQRLRAGGWFHFAGHGDQKPEEPDGLLYLWDHETSGSLRIKDIAHLRLERAELAYLSACNTHLAPRAHTDEPVSLAGALQLAGFRHVVAAQWPLQTIRAKRIATLFYRELLEPVAGGGGRATPAAASNAAYALHRAMWEQRHDRPEMVEVWAAYVHLGP